MRKIFAIIAIIAIAFAGSLAFVAPANASTTRHCVVKVIKKAYNQKVVDKKAWDETVTDKAAYDEVTTIPAWDETVIDKPAYDEVVHHPAVVKHHETVPSQWWNWSPNHTKGPQDYVPAFPTDSRGTWQGPHTNGGPRQDTYGTFQTGKPGNSDWFHRNRAVPAWDEVITPAWDETIHHPAVTHVVHHPAVTTTVHHNAVTHVVHHPAVTHIVHHAAVTKKVCCNTHHKSHKHHAHKHHRHHKHHHHKRVVVVVCGCEGLTRR